MTYQVKLELVAKDDTVTTDSTTFVDDSAGEACREIYGEYVQNNWITNFFDSAHSPTIKHETIEFDSAGRWDLYLAKMKEHSPSSEAHNFIATVISEKDV